MYIHIYLTICNNCFSFNLQQKTKSFFSFFCKTEFVTSDTRGEG